MPAENENITITNNDTEGHTAVKVNITSAGEFNLAPGETRDLELTPGQTITLTAQRAYPAETKKDAEDTRKRDSAGNLVDDDGFRINEQGQRVDDNGEVITQ